MEEQKTSAYSFALPAAGRGGARRRRRARRWAGSARPGGCWAIAFQLVDDLLGVFGDPRPTGKSATSDLRDAASRPRCSPTRDRTAGVGRDPRRTSAATSTDEELAEVRRAAHDLGLAPASSRSSPTTHLATARRVVEELGIAADLLATVDRAPPVLADEQRGGAA